MSKSTLRLLQGGHNHYAADVNAAVCIGITGGSTLLSPCHHTWAPFCATTRPTVNAINTINTSHCSLDIRSTAFSTSSTSSKSSKSSTSGSVECDVDSRGDRGFTRLVILLLLAVQECRDMRCLLLLHVSRILSGHANFWADEGILSEEMQDLECKKKQ